MFRLLDNSGCLHLIDLNRFDWLSKPNLMIWLNIEKRPETTCTCLFSIHTRYLCLLSIQTPHFCLLSIQTLNFCLFSYIHTIIVYFPGHKSSLFIFLLTLHLCLFSYTHAIFFIFLLTLHIILFSCTHAVFVYFPCIRAWTIPFIQLWLRFWKYCNSYFDWYLD